MLRHLEEMAIFAHVGELRSISAAARALRLPKSSVSRAVSRLEAELQARLVERSTRQLQLTEVGRAFLIHARAMAAEAENAVAEVAAHQGNPRGLLRVAMPATLARSILASEFPDFLDRHPAVDLALTVTDRLLNPVTDGYDVVIRAGWLEDSSLIVRKVLTIELGLYASTGYAAAHGLPATVADLAAHPAVALKLPGGPANLVLARGRERFSLPATPRLATNDPLVAAELVRRGKAIGLMNSLLVRDDLAAGRIVPLLPDWRVEDPPALHALYPSRTAMPPKVRVFLEWIDEVAARVQRTGGAVAERPA